jgi:biotin operon repressor
MSVDESQIARAVISQALGDAGLGMERGYRMTVSPLDRDEARAFLTANTGAWRQVRELWCSLADLDPARLRRRTLELLDKGKLPLVRPEPSPPPKRDPMPLIMRKRKAPMPGTKLSSVLHYLKRPEGVSLDELQQSLGWSRQAAQTGICEMRLYGIVTERDPGGRYRVVSLP